MIFVDPDGGWQLPDRLNEAQVQHLLGLNPADNISVSGPVGRQEYVQDKVITDIGQILKPYVR